MRLANDSFTLCRCFMHCSPSYAARTAVNRQKALSSLPYTKLEATCAYKASFR